MRRGTWFNTFNIHRDHAEPIFPGIRNDDLPAFNTSKGESLSRDTEATGLLLIRQQPA